MKAIIFSVIVLFSQNNFAKISLSQKNNLDIPSPNLPADPMPELPTENFELSASLAGSECFTLSRTSDACNVIMIPSLENLKIALEPFQFTCPPPTDNQNNNIVCETTVFQGDWLKSIYLHNQRYIGVITIQKYQNGINKDMFYYQAVVEILGKNKTIARMTTTFYDIGQIPHATLEAPEIIEESLGGTVTTKISLTIAPTKNFEIRPKPIESPNLPGNSILRKKNQLLSKVSWKVEKGNVVLK